MIPFCSIPRLRFRTRKTVFPVGAAEGHAAGFFQFVSYGLEDFFAHETFLPPVRVFVNRNFCRFCLRCDMGVVPKTISRTSS